MKKNTQKPKKSSEKKHLKKKIFKNNKGKSLKKHSGADKLKNKPNLKHGKDHKPKSPNKAIKTNKRKESKLEYKKRLNRLYSSLLLNHKDSAKSLESINSLLKELPPNYSQESNKRNVSRILQACLKYGTARDRSLIFEKVKENFNILNLNSHSSKFFIKLFHYCNVDVKQFLRDAFFNQKQKNLLFSRYGSDVMDVMYIKLKSKEQISVLKLYCLANTFFLNKEDSKRSKEINSINQLIDLILNSEYKTACIEKMCSVVTKLVEKELLVTSLSHDILFVYLHILEDKQPKKEPINSKVELLSQMYKIFGQLLSTRSGNSCMLILMDYANNKIKKYIVKCLKRDFPEAVYNQINVSLLIKAVNVTDDTKLTGECLINPLLNDLKRVVYDRNSCKFIMNILDNANEKSPNSLKEPELRTEELQSRLLPPLVEFFHGEDLKEVIETNHAGPILLHTLKLSRDAALVDTILQLVKENLEKFLNNVTMLRFLQSLVKSSNRVSASLVDLRVSEKIWELVKSDIDNILRSKSVFLLVDLLESFKKYGEEGLILEFTSKVTARNIARAKEEIEGGNSTGLDLLYSLLRK
ncbi:hypothetical protein MACJ_001554 [Theileria orientalis]|uniref:Uncharacterized protein n=1 Tax=Theileria orientalis TaxID=68886 RepID=A0A976MAD6_THEOR|nr:hypothetical protein MACJ_001554 [Theileria orientalis]